MSRKNLNSPISTSSKEEKKTLEEKAGFMEKHKGFVYSVVITIASFFILSGVAFAVMTFM